MRSVLTPRGRYFRLQLRKARREAGMSQEAAATALHKTQNYISKCERGDRRVDIVEACNFAALYRKPLSYFVEMDWVGSEGSTSVHR
jgi:transcriptional regulator with XRE-family HTH domain